MQSAVPFLGPRAARAAVFAFLLLALAGCGKEPVRPQPIASLTAPAAPTRTTRMPSDDDNGGNHGGIPSPPATWHGGRYSISIGPHLTTSDVLAQADTMPMVVLAKAEFAHRGYIRRSDLDTIVTSAAATTAFLGYQKPGYALNQMEAFILVVARRIDIPATGTMISTSDPGSFWSAIFPTTYYAVQVGGGLIEHAANDSILFLDTPEDPAIRVTSIFIGGSPIATIGTRSLPIAPQDIWSDLLSQYGFTSFDMWFFNISFGDIYQTVLEVDGAYWQAVCSAAKAGGDPFMGSLLIGFGAGVAAVIAPASGPIDAILIRRALITGGIGAAAAAANYWNDHRP